MLPDWMAVGLAISGALTVVFAAVFVVGERLFPPESPRSGAAVSGEWKRRGEIRSYLDAIGERYAEDHFVEGQHVAFYLPERDVAITFDGVAYFRIEKSPTFAVLVEHEMPGAHLGARLPFETPEYAVSGGSGTGQSGGSEREAVESAFSRLGLSAGASAEQVRDAYRERVKEVHPDHGGSEAEFRRLREAYTAAKQYAS